MKRDAGLILLGAGVGALAAFGYAVFLDYRDVHEGRAAGLTWTEAAEYVSRVR